VKTYSVSEIAEKIARSGEDMRVVGDRIRNWTREGLLTPIGERNPGTGRSRQYPETALLEALVLTAITESVGLQVVKVHTFPKVFDCVRQFLKLQPKGKTKTLLVISRDMRSDSDVSLARPEALTNLIGKSPADGHIIINLGRITERLATKE
jgi:hypothetical protein